MRMIKLLLLTFVFSPGLSYGEEILRLTDSFIFSKPEAAYSSDLSSQVQYVVPASSAISISSVIPAKAGIQTKVQNSGRIGIIPKGLSHFLSENQNCKIEGTVMIEPEENFHREDGSVSFRVKPDFSFGLNLTPFWGNAYQNAGDWEEFYGALISEEELANKGFHQHEMDGEIAPYGLTKPVEGAEWDASAVQLYRMEGLNRFKRMDFAETEIQMVEDNAEDLNRAWQSAFSSGNLTGEKVVEGVEITTAQEAYQVLSRRSSLYLVEPLGGGGGGGGSHLKIVGVLLPQNHYLESAEAMQAEIIDRPAQKTDFVQDGSSIALPAVQCFQP